MRDRRGLDKVTMYFGGVYLGEYWWGGAFVPIPAAGAGGSEQGQSEFGGAEPGGGPYTPVPTTNASVFVRMSLKATSISLSL